MPLLFIETGVPYSIVGIAGKEKEQHPLESLGLVPDTVVTVVAKATPHNSQLMPCVHIWTRRIMRYCPKFNNLN